MSVPLRVAACATAVALTLTPEMIPTQSAGAGTPAVRVHLQGDQIRHRQELPLRRRMLLHRRHHQRHLRHVALVRLRQAVRKKRTRMEARWQVRAGRAVRFAYRQRGKPYQWGGTGPRSYDCSGLVQRAWRAAGVSIPRVTYGQYRTGPHIARSQLRPGDLVFFHGLGHVGIYIGGDRFIHSPHTGSHVKVERLRGYYGRAFAGAVRPAGHRLPKPPNHLASRHHRR